MILQLRLDKALVLLGYAPTRTKAQELIKTRCVVVNGKVEASPSFSVTIENKIPTCEIKIINNSWLKYVSRAGLKLEGALKTLNISVSEKKILDVGQSTGGFTHCLLEKGAQYIVGVDVGHHQLAPSLQSHPQVKFYEGINAKELISYESLHKYKGSFDVIVMDVSFISIKKIIPQLKFFLKPQGVLLSLVKPQFELGAQALDKKGLVKNSEEYIMLESSMRDFCKNDGWNVLNFIESPILGGDGNKEFFLEANSLIVDIH